MKRILPAAALAVLLAHPALAQQANAAHGRQLFMTVGCYECHGTVGQGTTAGPRLAPAPLSAAAISAYIRNPAGQMPPFSTKVLSDPDIADIQAYLAMIKKPVVRFPGE